MSFHTLLALAGNPRKLHITSSVVQAAIASDARNMDDVLAYALHRCPALAVTVTDTALTLVPIDRWVPRVAGMVTCFTNARLLAENATHRNMPLKIVLY